jgi:DNA-binding NtrC family response regulator
MAASGNTTSPSLTEDPGLPTSAVCLVPAFVQVWSAEVPRRVGSVGLLHDPARPAATTFLLGRDGPDPADPAPRITWVRQIPGENLPLGPLTGNKLAHKQLRLLVVPGALEVTNIGAGKVFIDGSPLAQGETRRIAPRAVIQVRGHSMFLFMMRPVVIPVIGRGLGAPHVLGEPDADGLTGEGPTAWRLRAALAAAVLAGGHVFIGGESGTGKERAARGIHRRSGRPGDLVACNAATIVSTLAESQLFGNRAGYPNRGTAATEGLVFAAHGRTLFLDEIGDMTAELQTRLLRALEGWATRLGETQEQRIDVLFIGATNKDFHVAMRLDVFERFVYVVHTPTLARRIEDVTLIARALILDLAKRNPELAGRFVTTDAEGRQDVPFSPLLVRTLIGAHYPGNVRDLRNLLVAAMTEQTQGPLLPPADMTPWTAPAPPAPEEEHEADTLLAGLTGGSTEDRIRRTLKANGGNVSRTAKMLDMSRDKLRWWMKKFGIDPSGDE